MKAAPFHYAKPASIDEAISLKADYGDRARFLAGGQSLLPALNMRLNEPELLIDLNGLGELARIEHADGAVRIGALVRTKMIGQSPIISRHLPLLARCVEHIAHPAIRTLGTFGGSVALADPAAEWPACCVALDATMVARGKKGERSIPVRDFFQGLYATALEENELLVRVDFPVQPEAARSVALELCRRRGDYAIVGLLAQAVRNARTLHDPRIVLFGVADRPLRMRAVEEALAAEPSSARAADILDKTLAPQGDLYHAPATKKHLAKVLLARALTQLLH